MRLNVETDKEITANSQPVSCVSRGIQEPFENLQFTSKEAVADLAKVESMKSNLKTPVGLLKKIPLAIVLTETRSRFALKLV